METNSENNNEQENHKKKNPENQDSGEPNEQEKNSSDFLDKLDEELEDNDKPEESQPLLSASTPNPEVTDLSNDILNRIQNKLEPVDFYLLAGLKPTDKLTERHLIVLVVQIVGEEARRLNLSLGFYYGSIYTYNGKYWEILDASTLKVFLGNCAEKLGVDKYIARYYKFKSNLFRQFTEKAVLLKPKFSKDTILINFQNGTLEIISGVPNFREHRMSDILRYQLPFNYLPNAKAPLFEKFLNEVLLAKELQRILAEFFGSIFISSATLKLEKALYMYGSGSNGKSVIHALIIHTLGDVNVSSYTMMNLMKADSYYLPMLNNKLLNYSSELTGEVNADLFKQIVSGEPLSVRMIYGNPFTMTDYAKIAFNCNNLPREVEHTHAFFRRLLLVPFSVTIPEEKQDKRLVQKIVEAGELPGIFNWILWGLNRVLEQGGYTESVIVENAVKEYKAETDNVKSFLTEFNYVDSFDRYISAKFLSDEYHNFCRDYRYKPLNHGNFLKRLRALNVRLEKKNTGLVAYLEKIDPVIVPAPEKPIITNDWMSNES